MVVEVGKLIKLGMGIIRSMFRDPKYRANITRSDCIKVSATQLALMLYDKWYIYSDVKPRSIHRLAGTYVGSVLIPYLIEKGYSVRKVGSVNRVKYIICKGREPAGGALVDAPA